MTNHTSFLTQNDQRVRVVPRLDFRIDQGSFLEQVTDETDLLAPGVVVSFVSKWHHYNLRADRGGSTLLHFQAAYADASRLIALPRSKFNPTRNLVDVDTPLFDVTASLAEGAGNAAEKLGRFAMPYVLPDRYPYLFGLEEVAVTSMLRQHIPGVSSSYPGHVKAGSIAVSTPAVSHE